MEGSKQGMDKGLQVDIKILARERKKEARRGVGVYLHQFKKAIYRDGAATVRYTVTTASRRHMQLSAGLNAHMQPPLLPLPYVGMNSHTGKFSSGLLTLYLPTSVMFHCRPLDMLDLHCHGVAWSGTSIIDPFWPKFTDQNVILYQIWKTQIIRYNVAPCMICFFQYLIWSNSRRRPLNAAWTFCCNLHIFLMRQKMIFITSNPGLLHQQLNSIQTFFIVISHSLLLFLWFQAIKHFEVHSWPPSSVTRFGEILPFWQNIEVIWQIFRRLFGVWKSFQPNFVKLMYLYKFSLF